MSANAGRAKRWAQWLVGYMSLGPFAVALDLAVHLFPTTSAIQVMRNDSPYVHSLWIGCGFLGVITIALLSLRPLYGYAALVVLVAVYGPISFAVWHQSAMLHYWVPLAATGFATYGVFVGRQLESLKAE